MKTLKAIMMMTLYDGGDDDEYLGSTDAGPVKLGSGQAAFNILHFHYWLLV